MSRFVEAENLLIKSGLTAAEEVTSTGQITTNIAVRPTGTLRQADSGLGDKSGDGNERRDWQGMMSEVGRVLGK